jgi:hypothetical protein
MPSRVEGAMSILQGLREWIGSRTPFRSYCRRANRITDRCAAEEEGVACPCAAECPLSPVRLAFPAGRGPASRERGSILENPGF